MAERNSRYLLHGHEPLTSNFNSPALLTSLKKHLKWLQQETLRAIQVGTNRADIHQQNLIPSFIHENPIIHIPFLVLRENFINRIYDQNVGYWQPDLQVMDHLSEHDFGIVIVHYFGLSVREVSDAVEKMIQSGDHELAARTITWAVTQYPSSEALQRLKKEAFLKLKEKYQQFNPFKFIIYSEMINDETMPLNWSAEVRSGEKK